MFTGLVEALGTLRRRAGRPVARAFIEAKLGALSLGESISVNGVCLTVDRIAEGGFECDMSSETLDRSTLSAIPLGSRVHLERATPLGGRMGGHVVLGHVDGIGRVSAREPKGDAVRLEITIAAELARYVAAKGSVAIDGVSLTINGVGPVKGGELAFDLMLVPHTIGRTLLGDLSPGAQVNVEVDVLARYVARQLDLDRAGAASGPRPQAGEAGLDLHRDRARGTDEPDTDHDERLVAKLRAGGYL